MKLTVIRPIYVEGKVLVEGDAFETLEQHGRELIKKGYAGQVGDDAESDEKAEAEVKTQPETAVKEKADADSKAKTKGK